MPLNDTSVQLGAIAHFLLAPANTEPPTWAEIQAFDPSSSPAVGIDGWIDIGHTSIDNDVTPIYEGGESTVRGSRQRSNLREQTTPVVEGITLNLLQLDQESVFLFEGGGSVDVEGVFIIPRSAQSVERALTTVYMDGVQRAGEYRSRVSARKNGGVERASANFLEFPTRFTFLSGEQPDHWYGAGFTVPEPAPSP